MKKHVFIIFLAVGICQFSPLLAQKGYKKLERILSHIPDITFERIETPISNLSHIYYKLSIKQNIDHKDPTKGYFFQKAILAHKGFNRPTVMGTQGYGLAFRVLHEPTILLDANQIDIEHRFFGSSVPDSLDYQYLTLEQATADLHHINIIFKRIYDQSWVSTGISKGGVTTICYRYFYPNDVDASIPYVAPINHSLEDKRIYTFLDSIGSDRCRENIINFQRSVLQLRDKLLPTIKSSARELGWTFTYHTIEEAFEYAVLEYPFSFWQWGHSCEDIPPTTADKDLIFEHFYDVSDLSLFSDQQIEIFGPHYYQSATEIGYYGYQTDHIADLMTALPPIPYPLATFVPDNMEVQFDSTLMRKVSDWLKTEGNQFIYIYGALDTWSATAVPPSDEVDALWFFMEGKHHGNARLKQMKAPELQSILEALKRWLLLKEEEGVPMGQ